MEGTPSSRQLPFPDDPPLGTADWLIVGLALVLPTAVTWLYFVALDGQAAWLQQGAYGLGKSIQFVLPVAWVWLAQRSRSRLIAPRSSGIVEGVTFGLVVLAAMAAVYYLILKPAGLFAEPAIAVRTKVASFGIKSLAGYVAFAIFVSLVHSLLEEYYWRWFVFRQLARGLPLAAAIAISSVGFAAHHVLVLGRYFGYDSPLTWLFSAGVGIGGAAWAWLYARHGSLVGPWLSHAVVDATIFVIGWDLLFAA